MNRTMAAIMASSCLLAAVAEADTNVTGVSVFSDITGGFNGDLYAQLPGSTGSVAVLLNRVGLVAGNASQSADSFDIKLTDEDSTGHSYQNTGYTLTGGQLTDDFAVDSESVAGMDPSLAGANPNAQRTLFASDLSAGAGNGTLVSWGTTIAIPEPHTWALMVAGGAMLLALRRRR